MSARSKKNKSVNLLMIDPGNSGDDWLPKTVLSSLDVLALAEYNVDRCFDGMKFKDLETGEIWQIDISKPRDDRIIKKKPATS